MKIKFNVEKCGGRLLFSYFDVVGQDGADEIAVCQVSLDAGNGFDFGSQGGIELEVACFLCLTADFADDVDVPVGEYGYLRELGERFFCRMGSGAQGLPGILLDDGGVCRQVA